jgi:hypothetical protein
VEELVQQQQQQQQQQLQQQQQQQVLQGAEQPAAVALDQQQLELELQQLGQLDLAVCCDGHMSPSDIPDMLDIDWHQQHHDMSLHHHQQQQQQQLGDECPSQQCPEQQQQQQEQLLAGQHPAQDAPSANCWQQQQQQRQRQQDVQMPLLLPAHDVILHTPPAAPVDLSQQLQEQQPEQTLLPTALADHQVTPACEHWQQQLQHQDWQRQRRLEWQRDFEVDLLNEEQLLLPGSQLRYLAEQMDLWVSGAC